MKGILLVNLGSPESPDIKDVRTYLDEFLMDKYVIDKPYLFRLFLVRGIILNTRPKKSAAMYSKIWTKEGSPLVVLSRRMQKKIQSEISLPVSLAMRYGSISIKNGLQELKNQNVTEVFVLPLYPQYAMSATETVLEKAESLRKKYFQTMKFDVIKSFYNHPDYIKSLTESIKTQLETFDYDHLLFSYHGIPESHIYKTDPTQSHCKIDKNCCKTFSTAHDFCYRHQCYETMNLVVEALQIPTEKYSLSFQSRLGKGKWLEPYTNEVVKELAQKGIKKLAIVTPSFVADCLETIEEIGIENKEEFLQNGGEDFLALSCLNDDDLWCNSVINWIKDWEKV